MRRRPRPPLTGKQRAKALCFFLSAALTALAVVGTVHLRTLLGQLALTRVSNAVGLLVNDVVAQAIDQGDIRYDRLIALHTGPDGRVTALESDMAAFDRLQASLAQAVLARLEDMEDQVLEIPLGTLTGTALLAGRGPSFPVRAQSEGSCSVRFANRFTQAGINQTLHSIILYVDVTVDVLLPGANQAAEISNAYAVAETVIVGEVPDTYTYFDGGEDMADTAYEYAINQG